VGDVLRIAGEIRIEVVLRQIGVYVVRLSIVRREKSAVVAEPVARLAASGSKGAAKTRRL
jgi:hypothetical protein